MRTWTGRSRAALSRGGEGSDAAGALVQRLSCGLEQLSPEAPGGSTDARPASNSTSNGAGGGGARPGVGHPRRGPDGGRAGAGRGPGGGRAGAGRRLPENAEALRPGDRAQGFDLRFQGCDRAVGQPFAGLMDRECRK
ncbi:hypothetical protein GCM10010282_73430 [Streptomyces roseolus]|nr:hypothetical protein GCM10010282_73430 [Streptomyces roseolus]